MQGFLVSVLAAAASAVIIATASAAAAVAAGAHLSLALPVPLLAPLLTSRPNAGGCARRSTRLPGSIGVQRLSKSV